MRVGVAYMINHKAVDSMDNNKDSGHCDDINERERMGLLRTMPEIILDGDSSHHNENLHAKHSSLSSLSSSDSSTDNLFQVHAPEVHASKPSPSMHQQILRDDESCISMSPSRLLGADNIQVSSSTSQPSAVSQQAVVYGSPSMSPMSNPHMQVMARSGVYDPHRIPSSAFAVCHNTPIDWSIATNESLFSIHDRNQSFSRDYAFLLDELGKTEDPIRQRELLKSGEPLVFSPTFPSPVMDDLTTHKNMEVESVFQTSRTIGGVVSQQRTDNAGQESKIPGPGINWNPSNLSCHSDESGTSGKSFAFPILTDGKRNGSSRVFMGSKAPPTSAPKTTGSKPKTRSRCYFTFTSCTSCCSFSSCSCTSFYCCSCFSCISWRRGFPCFKSCSRCC